MKLEPRQQTYWDWRAAGNFILGGTGSGLLVVAGLANPAGPPDRLATATGIVLVAAGLGLVWLEIGRPLRFLNVFRNPWTSWMSREAWVAAALFPVAVAAVTTGADLLVIPVAVLAALFLYCQASIIRASRGIPAWRLPETVPLIVATGLLEGTALYLLISVARAVTPQPVGAGITLSILAFITARVLAAWRWRRALKGNAPRAAVQVMSRFARPFLLWGHLVPALAVLLARFAPGSAAVAAAIAAILAIALGWILKSRLILRAGHVQGFAIEKTPARGAGQSGPGVRPGWSG